MMANNIRATPTRALQTNVLLAAAIALLGLALPTGAAQAVSGEFCSLTASSAPNPDDTIAVTASLATPDRIQNSNIYYEISIGGTVVATHQSALSTLDGETCGTPYVDSWSLTNTGFPSSGTYTVTAYWRPGNCQSNVCAYASASTTFVSAPTLDGVLGVVALGLLGWLIWRRRDHFMPQSE